MRKLLAEEHPELFHYTNAAGLAGIIQSQTLWATHYAYLNDSEEIKHFHKNRMPDLLRDAVGIRLNELINQNPHAQSSIDQEGGKEKIIDRYVNKTLTALEDILWNNLNEQDPLAEPFITSFCSTKDNNERVKKHGLLSQWRGYGQGGGFAIVFNTAQLLQSLAEVRGKWEKSGNLIINDVMYSSAPESKFLEKFKEDLSIIKNFSLNSFR